MRAYIHYAMMCIAVSCLYSDALRSTAAGARQGELTNILFNPMTVRFYERCLRDKGYDPADLESIKAAAADPKWPSARWFAIDLLGARMGKDAVPIFRPVLDDPYPTVRWHAARLLGIFGDKGGLVRMRKDLADLTPARSAAAIDEATDLNDRQKQDAKRQRILRLDDALAAARVLAEFNDHSGYDLAVKVIKGDELPGARVDAVNILYYISNTDLATLRAEKLDPDGVLLALAQTEQAPGVIAALHGCGVGYWRPEVGVRIMETLLKSPHVTEKQRKDIERSLQYCKEHLAKATPSAPPEKK
jgi:hypothetical protein